MGIAQRISTGVDLTIDSVRVLRNNASLAIFPAVGGVGAIVFFALILGGGSQIVRLTGSGAVPLVALFLAYAASTFVSALATAGLVQETREVFRGNDVDVRRGFEVAWERRRALAVWALISATVGVIISVIESSNRFGKILSKLFAVGWTVMTFFVIPVVVFEDVGYGEMFSRSSDTFQSTWGETGVSLVGAKLVGAVVGILGVVVAFTIASLLGVTGLGILLAIPAVILAFLVSATVQGIIRTTLYVYATDGVRPAEFENANLDEIGA